MASKTKQDFRGLTIFELSIILLIIGSVFYWAFTTKRSLQNNLDDALRKARVVAAKEHLKSYIIENDSFPSTEAFQDEEQRKEIFSSLLSEEGEDALKDPKEKDVAVDYIAEPVGCAPDTDNPCTRVSLSLTLNNGDDFSRFVIKPGSELEQLQTLNESEGQTEEDSSAEEQQLMQELEQLDN